MKLAGGIKEEYFYNLLDNVDKLDNVTNDYYPTVQELKENGIEQLETLIKLFPTVMYFASDPLTRLNAEGKDDKEYKEVVDYCKKILPQIPLIE